MKTYWLILGTIAASFFSPAEAQQHPLELKFEIYQGDSVILDALESRLLKGGQPAAEAMAKLPEFVRSRKVELLDEVAISTPSGQRAKGKSSDKQLKGNDSDWMVTDGMEIEIDPVLVEATGTVDLNLFMRWARKEGRVVRFSELTTSVESRSGKPLLLQRWGDGEDSDTMLILTATAPGIQPSGPLNNVIYVDTTVFPSEAHASGKRNRIARMLFPTRSGQRCKSVDAISRVYDVDDAGSQEVFNVGLTVEMDPILSADGSSIDLNLSVEFSEENGTVRAADGVRIPKFEIRKGLDQLNLEPGKPEILEMKKLVVGVDPNGEADDWRTTLEFKAVNDAP